MATEPLTIQVDEEAARAFKEASPEEQRKLEAIVSLQLIEATKPSTPLRNLMQTISQRARAGTDTGALAGTSG
jgi:hypothetical protein